MKVMGGFGLLEHRQMANVMLRPPGLCLWKKKNCTKLMIYNILYIHIFYIIIIIFYIHTLLINFN